MNTLAVVGLLLLGVMVQLERAKALPHPTLGLLTDPSQWPLTHIAEGMGLSQPGETPGVRPRPRPQVTLPNKDIEQRDSLIDGVETSLPHLHHENKDRTPQVPTIKDTQQPHERIGDKQKKPTDAKTPALESVLRAGVAKPVEEDPNHNKDHTLRNLPPALNKDIKLCGGKPCEMMEKEAMMGKTHEEGTKGVGTAIGIRNM